MSLRGWGCDGVGLSTDPGRHTPILMQTQQDISLSEGYNLWTEISWNNGSDFSVFITVNKYWLSSLPQH